MWQLSDHAEGKSKVENAQILKSRLEALVSHIPEIVEISVGIDVGTIQGNFDAVLESKFNTWSDLEAYAIHAKHKEVGGWIGKVTKGRCAVDYEIGN